MPEPLIQYAMVCDRFIPNAREFVLLPLHRADLKPSGPDGSGMLHYTLVTSVVWPQEQHPVRLTVYDAQGQLAWGPAQPAMMLSPDPEVRQYWWGVECPVSEPGKWDFHLELDQTSTEIHIPFRLTLSADAPERDISSFGFPEQEAA